MSTMTLQDFVLQEFNKMLRDEGREVEVVLERPRPQLAVDRGQVIDLREPCHELSP